MATLFGFIGNLRTISASEITNNCKVLIKKYSTDINDELINETIHFSKYVIESDRYNTITKITVLSDYKYVREIIDVYPNIEIVCRIYLSLMVSNSIDERSFSKFKLVKKYLRNSLT